MLIVPTLSTRALTGQGLSPINSPLTNEQADANVQSIATYLAQVNAQLGRSLDSNGVLKCFFRDTGTQNAYRIDPSSRIVAPATPISGDYLSGYVDGLVYLVQASYTNTGDCTLSVASGPNAYLAAIPLRLNGTALPSGTIQSGGLFLACYDAVNLAFNVLAVSSGSSNNSSNGTVTAASSGFITYNPLSNPLPGVGSSLTLGHGFGLVPTAITVGLICTSAELGFDVGQFVPISSIFKNATPITPAFVVQSNDTNLIVTEVATPSLVAPTSGGGYTAGTVYAITAAKWQVSVSAYIFNSPNLFTAIPEALSSLTSLAPSVQFAHGLGIVPQYKVNLVNLTPELGYLQGTSVPINQFEDGSGRPAFSVVADPNNITVVQNVFTPSGPYLPSLVGGSVGTMTQITQANWQITCSAFNPAEPSASLTPAIEFVVSNPDGALGYGSNLFAFNYGLHTARTNLSQLDLTNGNVSQVCAMPSGSPALNAQHYINSAPFRWADGTDRMIWTSDNGLGSVNMGSPSGSVSQYGNLSCHYYKPVWVANTGGSPDFYVVGSAYNYASGFMTNSLAMRKIASASSWASSTAIGSVLSLHNISGSPNLFDNFHSNSAGTAVGAELLLFQYNPVKKRIYVMTNECAYLFIFNLQSLGAGVNDISAWWATADPGRKTGLAFEKAIVVPGGGGLWANTNREHIAVEFDLTTGIEASISYTRVNSASQAGSVSYVPWRE